MEVNTVLYSDVHVHWESSVENFVIGDNDRVRSAVRTVELCSIASGVH